MRTIAGGGVWLLLTLLVDVEGRSAAYSSWIRIREGKQRENGDGGCHSSTHPPR